MELEAHADLLTASDGAPPGCYAASPAAADAGDEQRLVERARSDPAAFATLYRRYYRDIARYVYRRTGDAHATEDVVAEVFMTALRRLGGFRWRGVSVRYWLYRIATNRVGHWSRRRRREERRIAGFADSGGRGGVGGDSRADAQADEIKRLQFALLRLTPRYQAVLSLHYLEGMSVEETAAVLGCRGGTVKSRLSRAREALRVMLVERREK